MNKSTHSPTEGPRTAELPPRIAQLVERFRIIGETAMRELPIYNPDLEVEAVGFQRLGGHWIGVLITPWFMNLLRLPQALAPMEMACLGRKLKVTLPSGERELIKGGDEVIGAYESLSLHSPMFPFGTQEAARQEAERRLTDLMCPAEQPVPNDNGRLRAEVEPPKMSRRAFIRGTRTRT